jgi:hypothetical protein
MSSNRAACRTTGETGGGLCGDREEEIVAIRKSSREVENRRDFEIVTRESVRFHTASLVETAAAAGVSTVAD